MSAIPNAIAIINKKGGSGKTTLACQLAGLAASPQARVLLVDLDPQGNTALDLGLAPHTTPELLAALQFESMGFAPTILRDVRPGLDVMPGGPALEEWSAVASSRLAREDAAVVCGALQRLLLRVAGDYELVVIDCPPGGTHLQQLALAAANYVICPVRDDAASHEGLKQLAEQFLEVRGGVNPDPELLGVAHLFTPANGTSIRGYVEREVSRLFGSPEVLLAARVRLGALAARDVRRDGRLVHEYADAAAAAPAYWASRRAGIAPQRFSVSAEALAADWRALVQEVLERYVDAVEARLAAEGSG